MTTRNGELFDVAIAGGGPAGSAAGIICAAAGLRVCLLETAPFPRDKPGETLHPGVDSLWRVLHVGEEIDAAGFRRSDGHFADVGGGPVYVPYGSDVDGVWLAYQAWRADLDALLLRRAAISGVQVLQPCTARQPIIENGRIAGIVTDRGPIRSAFVVDASGGSHWLQRRAGLMIQKLSGSLTATYGYVSDAAVPDDRPKLVMRNAGWVWVAGVRRGLVAWVELTEGADMLSDAGLAPEARCSARGADVTWRLVPECSGPGYFIAGDAAAVIDPASSNGVLRALASGVSVAQNIVSIVRDGASEAELCFEYRRMTKLRVAGITQNLLDTYLRHAPRLADRVLSR